MIHDLIEAAATVALGFIGAAIAIRWFSRAFFAELTRIIDEATDPLGWELLEDDWRHTDYDY